MIYNKIGIDLEAYLGHCQKQLDGIFCEKR